MAYPSSFAGWWYFADSNYTNGTGCTGPGYGTDIPCDVDMYLTSTHQLIQHFPVYQAWTNRFWMGLAGTGQYYCTNSNASTNPPFICYIAPSVGMPRNANYVYLHFNSDAFTNNTKACFGNGGIFWKTPSVYSSVVIAPNSSPFSVAGDAMNATIYYGNSQSSTVAPETWYTNIADATVTEGIWYQWIKVTSTTGVASMEPYWLGTHVNAADVAKAKINGNWYDLYYSDGTQLIPIVSVLGNFNQGE